MEVCVTTLTERTGVPVPRPGRFAAMVVVANPAMREAVAHTLRALGARHVLEVSSVSEARQRAGAGIADLVVAEAGLPDGSGIALIRELRAAGCTVTRVVSESFGALADRPPTVELEVRASWTPLDGVGRHVQAWSTLLCTVAGLPPLPHGVAALTPRRRGR